ncbi:fumarate reductase subunit d [Bacillus sp. OxB-1]|uniref:hypothetical protein n=1 Tax=Bacillus sp. (strain OxB-1) TaxID=98228 RepID=UPI0005820A9E|nr:hypothetical protein [Bacillus sp. OxB-1]BAQ10894.1 fumarate reductase subunit d [Bacillus sp. OxB-1]
MSKKLVVYMAMLIIGSSLLIVSLTVTLPEPVKWGCIAVAVILNVTSAVASMRAGLQQMKPGVGR